MKTVKAEKKVDAIVAMSSKLFKEKGYDKTSIQNIIDTLGISKGGLYHHFKSKEEILAAVFKYESTNAVHKFNTLVSTIQADNAREKIILILNAMIDDTSLICLDKSSLYHIANSHFILESLKKNINYDAPIIANIISDGVNDGSIHTDYPDELAEVFLLLLNFWIHPIVFKRSMIDTKKRLSFLSHMLINLGLDVIDDNMQNKIISVYENLDFFT